MRELRLADAFDADAALCICAERHTRVRIQREIIGLVIPAVLHAGIDALVGEIEFAQAPQYFLDIDRVGPAPNPELALFFVWHAFSLPMIRSPRVISEFWQESAR